MNHGTILCVDDEPNVLKSLRRTLRREEYHVVACNSGAEALAKLNELTPEVVITDQRMPGMTGTELLAQVKERCPQAVRVVLSGYADAASILESINRGHIFRFLTKPWNDEELREAIRLCVRQHELDSENKRLACQLADANTQLKSLNERLADRVAMQTRFLQFAQDAVYRVPVPIIGIDLEGLVVLINDAAAAELTSLWEVTVGSAATDVLPPILGRAVRAVLEDGRESIEFAFEEPSSRRPRLRKASVRRLMAGELPRGCIVTLRD